MSDRTTNRLALEKSPYLLQHAHNPVDWYPFGAEAVARAKREDKPIFLSIGYSTCHWCHVMERESFEDDAIARVLNEHYVCIKVDREERPDVDQIYMQALLRMTGQGGWPLNVWLTPELEPFHGGTYFPPAPRWGRPGFATLLTTLSQIYRDRRSDVRSQAHQMVAALTEESATQPAPAMRDAVARACEQLTQSFDSEWGGFGGAPKFPRPSDLALLAHRAARVDSPVVAEQLDITLEKMWRGGLYDHVGGGFARYSTDEQWLVPHFEKMLYDNALLVESYLDGACLLQRTDHADVAQDVLAFVRREMTHPEGGFFSAQDADSEGEEGRFYVFERQEFDDILGPDAERAATIYGVTQHGNFEGRNILHWPCGIDATARAQGWTVERLLEFHREVRGRLYRAREARIRPGLDDKILASWNGLMIHAAARVGAVLGDAEALAMARRAAEFVQRCLRTPEGALLRRWRDGDARFDASLDDYAFVARGHLGLFEATGESCWLTACIEDVRRAESLFAAPDGGFYFAAARDDLVVRMKDSDDNATPSGNGVMALLYARLGALLSLEDLRDRGRQVVAAFANRMQRIPHAFPNLAMASQELEELPRTVFVAGDPEHPGFGSALRRIHADLLPGRVVIPVLPSERTTLENLGVPVEGKVAFADGAPRVYVCEEGACRPESSFGGEWPGSRAGRRYDRTSSGRKD